MTRVFRVTRAEHLKNDKEGAEKVDSWRTVTYDVAVDDGDVVDAISKLKGIPPQGLDTSLLAESRILGAQLVTEAL